MAIALRSQGQNPKATSTALPPARPDPFVWSSHPRVSLGKGRPSLYSPAFGHGLMGDPPEELWGPSVQGLLLFNTSPHRFQ